MLSLESMSEHFQYLSMSTSLCTWENCCDYEILRHSSQCIFCSLLPISFQIFGLPFVDLQDPVCEGRQCQCDVEGPDTTCEGYVKVSRGSQLHWRMLLAKHTVQVHHSVLLQGLEERGVTHTTTVAL